MDDPNPTGTCMCGCGAAVSVVTRTDFGKGMVKGHHRRFLLGHGKLNSWVPEGTKFCHGCNEAKPIGDFRTRLDGKGGGVKGRCRPCENSYNYEWARMNREKDRLQSQRHWLKKKYGMTPSDFENLLQSQSGVCAICGEPEQWPARGTNGRPKRLSIDHNHATGKVRGLLCHRCNLAVGYLEDNPRLLEPMIAYLEKHA